MSKKYNPKEYIKNKESEFTNEMVKDTLKYQKQYGFDIGQNNVAWNNEADAFRHAYMQSILSKRITPYFAKRVSDSHEEQGLKKNQDPREANMDLWNNQQGQQIYNEICKEYPNFKKLSEQQQKDIIAKKVVQRMRSGQLITNPNDKRKYEKQNNNNLPFTSTKSIDGIQNNGKPTGYATLVQNSDNVFTPQEIGKMTPEEFSQNESAIMQQMKDGLIKNQQPKIDYSNYNNPISKNKEIFTREDIAKMSTKEFSKHEKAINAQMKDIGIPYKKDLPKNATTHTERKEKSQSNNSSEGKWVTINGNHVLIDK